MPKKSKSKRSLAAKKGWKTRRANLRSEAAKRGWKTRRKNLAKKKKPVKKKKKVTRKIRGKKTEYQINVRYDATVSSNKVEIQISAKGPSDQTREQVIAAVEYKMARSREGIEGKESDPRVWELHIIFWEKKGRRFFGDDAQAWNQLSFLFGFTEKEVADENGETI